MMDVGSCWVLMVILLLLAMLVVVVVLMYLSHDSSHCERQQELFRLDICLKIIN